MVVAVTTGVVLAALLFMRRMAEVSDVRPQHPIAAGGLPPDVLIYEVAGPLFFGAAQKAMSALQRVPSGIRVVVLDLASVPVIDATGLVSLESAVARLHGLGMSVVLGGVQDQPARVLARSELPERGGQLAVCRTMEEGLALAGERVAG